MRHPILAIALAMGSLGFAGTAQAQRTIAPPSFGGSIQPSPAFTSAGFRMETSTPRQAAPSDIRKRATLFDREGRYIGWVESVRSDIVVVRFFGGRAEVPIASLGVDRYGLRVSLTRRDFLDRAKRTQASGQSPA
ncbi:hypothetical protein P1X14_07860 [Sphingomonas sp. AOB5]|uniref:hypothetical protein n=1 Tax=Sphingomonas sp. AOB5 TaxID=3034017 RepID=UPI0023F6C7CA|nr:hypothetical protein [Sphingomonas sp. AOB5]MDF7775158.1 hypothetical protein [Sphingomonas sp. AOB5]